MYHDKRNEAPRVEEATHFSSDIVKKSALDCCSSFTRRQICGLLPSRPSPFSFLWQSVIVHHSGRNAVGILFEVTNDVPLDAGPRPYSATPVPQSRITNDPGTDRLVTYREQVIPKNFVDERFLCLTFQVNQ